MIRRIAEGDFFSIPDRYGRFHSNLTNLKKTLRPFLRYRDSELVNLDIANSQPMVFCLLLVNLLSNNGKLNNLIDYEFSESSNPYAIDIDEAFLLSLSSSSSLSSAFHSSSVSSLSSQEDQETRRNEEGEEALPILRRFNVENSNKPNYDNELHSTNFSYDKPETYRNIQELQNNKEGEGEALPILRRFGIETSSIVNNDNTLRQENFSYGMTDNWADDVNEFIDLCERGVLYDDLMRRLDILPRRRDSFKRLFFSQVFFGKIKTTGRVRELFGRDFPNVYKAINDLKRKDYRQLAYLLQAHESKIMIDVICRRILDELPGTFIATIHDSIMTTPDKAEVVKAIMVREFERFGLNPIIRLEP